MNSLRKLLPALWKETKPRVDKINVGGGPNFSHPGWFNIEEVASGVNPNPITLDAQTVFPFPNQSVSLVYTSHALEHLSDATVSRVLDESRRCLKRGGSLVVKIPDFDAVLRAWREKDMGFLSNQNWGYDAVTWSWQAKGVQDNVTSRASVIFAGFWNKEYGQHFAKQINRTPTSYFGPAVCSEQDVEQLFASQTPHDISRTLAQRIKQNEPTGFTYVHQNGWSREEFCTLLCRHGFRPASADKEKLCTDFPDIPGLREMFGVSLYLHARVG